MTTEATSSTSQNSSPLSPSQIVERTKGFITDEEYIQPPAVLLLLTLAEVRQLSKRIDEIEAKADEMMSPEKMIEMAGGFLGMSPSSGR